MKIVLITEKYPYGQREQFLDAELQYCKENNINIDIIPQNVNFSWENHRQLPENVSLKLIGNPSLFSLQYLVFSVQALISPDFREEMAKLKNSKMLCKDNIKAALFFFLKALFIKAKLEKEYGNILSEKPEEITFYTYWMVEAACAIAMLKKQYGCKAISRVHGYDLYLERHANSYSPFHEWIVAHLDRVHPVTKAGKDYLESRYGKRGNIEVQYLGTDDYGMSPQADSNVYTILSCSNVIPIKRVDLIANAIKLIDDKRVHWVHFGDGVSFDNVASIVMEIQNAKCELAGRKTHQEVFDYYCNNHVDLFINVSTTEGLPVSIMEAMSFGIPTIATDVGGTYEIVNDGVNGRLLKSDITAAELASEIREMMNKTTDETRLLRDNARSVWEMKFSARQAFYNFYKSMGE